MTVELADEAAPEPVAFVLAHLFPLALSDKHIGAKKWTTGMEELPYRWVTCVVAPEDDDAAYPVVRTHTIARSYTAAMAEGLRTHRRMRILVLTPWVVGNAESGQPVDLLWCETLLGPTVTPYTAESVATHVVSEYRLGIGTSFVAV